MANQGPSSNPIRQALAFALMVAAITGTAAAYLHEPLFLFGGFLLFLFFYVWKINPQIRAAFAEENARALAAQFADDASYGPILAAFQRNHNDKELLASYDEWKTGNHSPEVRLRFLQSAIIDCISAHKIYSVEPLLSDMEKLSESAGLTGRFLAFRQECDNRIAQIAAERLGRPSASSV